MDIPDHPIIQSMERTGYPDGKEPQTPICPICGEECETIYKEMYGSILGCDICISREDAWDVDECFPERSE